MTSNKYPSLEPIIDEAIFIIREAVQNAKNPVLLFSIGKDSMVLLKLLEMAFAPGKVPIPLLHVDTGWKFKEMIEFRNKLSEKFNILTFINEEGRKENISPFNDKYNMHTDIMKTQSLKMAIAKYNFDVLLGGARRDEERSRAKERIISIRNSKQQWDPKNQRPEFNNIFNMFIREDQSLRVFPISNWTEIDIWRFIKEADIEIVDLYFAQKRKLVNFNGSLIHINDDRVPSDLEVIEEVVRFRTLGCYPLTGAIKSDADDIDKIIEETFATETSERSNRMIDNETNSSLEEKKKNGYF